MRKSPLMMNRLLGRMTPFERAAGRYLRSEGGHPDAAPAVDAPAAPVADAPVADAPAPDAPVDASILGDAGAEKPADAPAADADDADDDADADKADGAEGAEGDGEEAAPYADLTPPEGFEALDTEALAAATPLMRAFGVPDDKAQDFINQAAPIISGMVEKALAGQAQATLDSQATLKTQWAEEVKADPEIGGAHYDRTVSLAAKALDKFFSPEFRNFLSASGLGNNPDAVRGFAKIGASVSDDDIITGEPGNAPKKAGIYDERFSPPEQRGG